MLLGYWGVIGGIALAALMLVLLACWILARGSWVWAWIRANLGLCVLALAVCTGLLGYDFSRYQSLSPSQPVATVSFAELGPQRYQVSLVQTGQPAREVVLDGDLWQLELRALRWDPSLQAFGFASAFRAHQIRSRYYLLEQELQTEPSALLLNNSLWSADLWELLSGTSGTQGLLKAQLLQSVAMPMADGALYAVKVGPSGALEVEPVNTVAVAQLAP